MGFLSGLFGGSSSDSRSSTTNSTTTNTLTNHNERTGNVAAQGGHAILHQGAGTLNILDEGAVENAFAFSDRALSMSTNTLQKALAGAQNSIDNTVEETAELLAASLGLVNTTNSRAFATVDLTNKGALDTIKSLVGASLDLVDNAYDRSNESTRYTVETATTQIAQAYETANQAAEPLKMNDVIKWSLIAAVTATAIITMKGK